MKPSAIVTGALLVLMASASSAQASSFSVSGPTATGVDTDPATTVSLTVPGGLGNITDVNIQVSLNSNFSDEVELSITHNSITVVLLAVAYDPLGLVIGGVSPNGYDLTFDDAAATPPTPLASSGTFQPTGPGVLADFNGIDSSGTWTLSLRDFGRFQNDNPTTDLLSWTVFGTTDDAPVVVPEPGTYAIFALGLLGLAGFVASRRRARLAPARVR